MTMLTTSAIKEMAIWITSCMRELGLALMLFLAVVFVSTGTSRAENIGDYIDVSERIINGTVSDAVSWPWMAALVERPYLDVYGQFCGGALIDPQWVLTAAHCFRGRGATLSASDVDIVLGKTNLRGDSGERIHAVELIIHPYYNEYTFDFDVALVRLEHPYNADCLSIIPMNDPSKIAAEGKDAIAMGWGTTSSGDAVFPDDLMEVSLNILSQDLLVQSYGLYLITDNMLGASAPNKDTCRGDSGGPLVVRDSIGGEWVQAGIVSFGSSMCADPEYPGVYTRLSNFSDWVYSRIYRDQAAAVRFSPCQGADNVPLDENIVITFSKEIDPATVNSSSVVITPAISCKFSTSGDNRSVTIDPEQILRPGETYSVLLNNNLRDGFGNSIACEKKWSFRTARATTHLVGISGLAKLLLN